MESLPFWCKILVCSMIDQSFCPAWKVFHEAWITIFPAKIEIFPAWKTILPAKIEFFPAWKTILAGKVEIFPAWTAILPAKIERFPACRTILAGKIILFPAKIFCHAAWNGVHGGINRKIGGLLGTPTASHSRSIPIQNI